MRVQDFPRPRNDNRRGIHWSASTYHLQGSQLDRWINELQAMNIKWVKLLDDSGGSSLEFCKRLVAADIYPIVRLYRQAPNPGHISSREADTVRAMVACGVHYFETNNEPDLPLEWKNGKMPDDWLDVVIDNFIHDADSVIALGGLPAVPAMGVGSKDTPVERIVAKGRTDLFNKGAWLAIHNYTLNHPLDYPYDAVNQEGAPLSQEEFDRLGPWAWDSQPRELINQWRASDKNPGKTLADDPVCFLAWKLADEVATRAIGHPVPIISTEGGPVMGWRDDRRYPRLTPQLHAEWVVAINNFVQGNGDICGLHCPDNYFTMCYWLLGNQHLGYFNITWESQSWYSDWWNTIFGTRGHLPVVDAVKAMPNMPVDRTEQGVVSGVLLRADNGQPLPGLNLDLQVGDRVVASTASEADGHFRFEHLPLGKYDLVVAGRGMVQEGLTASTEPYQPLSIRLVGGNRSVLSGKVIDVAGAPRPGTPVTLSRDRTVVAEAVSNQDGAFRFEKLSLGAYQVSVPGIVVAGLALDGWLNKAVKLTVGAPAGFRYVVVRQRLLGAGEPGQRNAFYGIVSGPDGTPMDDIKLRMSWQNAEPGMDFPVTVTGSDPYKPKGYYQFTHTQGAFQLQVVHGDWPSEVAGNLDTAHVPGREGQEISYEVDFQKQAVGASAHIEGLVPGGPAGARLALASLASPPVAASIVTETMLGGDGAFALQSIPPGHYQLSLEGVGVVAPNIQLEPGGLVTLMLPMRSRLQGQVLNAPRDTVIHLWPPAPWDWSRQTVPDPDGKFSFPGLPAGRYRLEVAGRNVTDLQLNGENSLLLEPIELSRNLLPEHTVLEGRVLAEDGTPRPDKVVHLRQDGVNLLSTQAGPDGLFRFCGMPPGVYALAVGDAAPLVSTLPVGQDATVVQNLTLPASADRLFVHYLLLSPPSAGAFDAKLALDLALPYLMHSGASGGFSIDEARLAARVTIVGDLVPETAEETLQAAGCQVTRLAGDAYSLAAQLDQLLLGLS